MKKILAVSALIITGAVTSFAQTNVANLKVNLADIRTIEVLTPNVVINVTTGADYINASNGTGVTAAFPAHLKVVSKGGFKVKATSNGNLQGPNGGIIQNDKIEMDILAHTQLSSGASGELTGLQKATAHNLLNNQADPIITTATVGGGTVGTTFDVNYTLKNVADIANLPVGAYTSTVTYTIEAN